MGVFSDGGGNMMVYGVIGGVVVIMSGGRGFLWCGRGSKGGGKVFNFW